MNQRKAKAIRRSMAKFNLPMGNKIIRNTYRRFKEVLTRNEPRCRIANIPVYVYATFFPQKVKGK